MIHAPAAQELLTEIERQIENAALDKWMSANGHDSRTRTYPYVVEPKRSTTWLARIWRTIWHWA